MFYAIIQFSLSFFLILIIINFISIRRFVVIKYTLLNFIIFFGNLLQILSFYYLYDYYFLIFVLFYEINYDVILEYKNKNTFLVV
jgi:hypothetical protein